MEDKLVTLSIETISRAQILDTMLKSAGVNSFISSPTIDSPNTARVRINIIEYERALPVVEEFMKNEGYNLTNLPEGVSFNKILVPIGFTDYSMNALDFAAGIARIHDSEIHLFHAYPEPSTEVPPFSSEGIEGSINIPVDYKAIEEEVESKLIKLCVDFRRKLAEKGLSDIKISHSKASGVVDQKIKNALSDFNPDIIVLGTKGRGKKNNSFIGRVTSKIIRLTEKPVLAIPQFTKPESFMNSEIMFATNFDHTDPSSLKTLIKMAEPFNSNIHCVHIGDKDIDNVIKLRLKHLEDEFKNVPTNCKLTFEYIDDNNPLERLQDYILEHEIKIISLTMHRYNFITSLFRPSFTEKVLFHTNVPVLIFHA